MSKNRKKLVTHAEPIRVQCVFEPRGEHGLEGFQRGDHYWAQQNDFGQGIYWRIWPEGCAPTPAAQREDKAEHYEVCGGGIFNRYFALAEPVSAVA